MKIKRNNATITFKEKFFFYYATVFWEILLAFQKSTHNASNFTNNLNDLTITIYLLTTNAFMFKCWSRTNAQKQSMITRQLIELFIKKKLFALLTWTVSDFNRILITWLIRHEKKFVFIFVIHTNTLSMMIFSWKLRYINKLQHILCGMHLI